MILEIDTSILDRIPTLSINQLVFLTLVLSDIKVINQDIQKLLSLVNEEEIQELANQGLICINVDNTNNQVISKTSKLEELLKEDKAMFDEDIDDDMRHMLEDEVKEFGDLLAVDEDLADSISSRLDIMKIIHQLPPKQYEVFILVVFKGLKYKQVAKLLHISVQAVSKNYRKALAFINKSLEK